MDILIIHIKSEDIYAHLAGDVEKRFDTSSYEVEKQKSDQDNKR